MLWQEVGYLGDRFAELGVCLGVIGDSLTELLSEDVYTLWDDDRMEACV